jgi:hypothetical protein
MARGRMKYVPTAIIDELEHIKADHGLSVEVEAFKKMAQYAQVGREVERVKKPRRGGLF